MPPRITAPRKDESLPKPLRDQELRTFRQALYDQQAVGGDSSHHKQLPLHQRSKLNVAIPLMN